MHLKPNQGCDKVGSVVLKPEIKDFYLSKTRAPWKGRANNWMEMYKFSVTLWNSIKMYGDK